VNRTQVEDLSHHRSAPEECALGVVQLIQTGGQQSLDRRRDRNPLEIRRRDPAIALAPDHPIVDQHRNRLLREQRVALGGVDDPRTRGVVDASDQVLHEPLGFLGRQGLQRDRGRVELPAAPVRPEVQQIRPRHADHQDRRVPAPVGDLIHEVEQAGLSPLQVVQHDDQRLRTGQALQEPADGPSDLLRGERQPVCPPTSCATRVATSEADASSRRSASIEHARSPGSAPTTSRTISTSGQKVIPSP